MADIDVYHPVYPDAGSPPSGRLSRKKSLHPKTPKVKKAKRDALILRDGSNCCWRGAETILTPPPHPQATTIEHMIPLSKGGTWRMENLKIACYACNHKRGNNV